jgi:hypothetical protein
MKAPIAAISGKLQRRRVVDSTMSITLMLKHGFVLMRTCSARCNMDLSG